MYKEGVYLPDPLRKGMEHIMAPAAAEEGMRIKLVQDETGWMGSKGSIVQCSRVPAGGWRLRVQAQAVPAGYWPPFLSGSPRHDCLDARLEGGRIRADRSGSSGRFYAALPPGSANSCAAWQKSARPLAIVYNSPYRTASFLPFASFFYRKPPHFQGDSMIE